MQWTKGGEIINILVVVNVYTMFVFMQKVPASSSLVVTVEDLEQFTKQVNELKEVRMYV